MPPAEWHWWNYFMVLGGLLIMAASAYVMARDFLNWWANRGQPRGVAHSVNASGVKHHWGVPPATATVRKATFRQRLGLCMAKIMGAWRLLVEGRVTPRDEEAVKQNPGNGWSAARLIQTKPFDEAVAIYKAFKLAAQSVDQDRVRIAMRERLLSEGPTPKTLEFLHSPDELKKRQRPDDDNAAEGQYYWEVWHWSERIEQGKA